MTRQQQVYDLYQRGKARGEIALAVGTTLSTVSRDLRKMGVEPEHGTTVAAQEYRAELAPQVRTLAEQGVTSSQICKRLQTSHDTLRAVAAEYDITLPVGKTGRPSKKDTLFPQARSMWEGGATQSAISAELGVPLGTLSRWFHDEGVEVHRIEGDTSRRHLNFGITPEEKSETGRQGGVASGEALLPVECALCGRSFARKRGEDGRGSRGRYCSRECAFKDRRESSGKTATYTCKTCGNEFQGWTANHRDFCSRKCYHRHTPTKVGVGGVVLDSWWEASLMSTARMTDVPCARVDRKEAIEWALHRIYAPDFFFPSLGLHVEVKGVEDGEDQERWAAWREQRGPLVVLGRQELDAVRQAPDAETFVTLLRSFLPATEVRGTPVGAGEER